MLGIPHRPVVTLVTRVHPSRPLLPSIIAYNFFRRVIAMPAIEILGLEKIYNVGFWRKRSKRALWPLTLSIEAGEIFGFLGPNGAGKTTTLKLLMGLVFPSTGSARILGMELDNPRMKSQ